ncbi:ribonuclease J1 [Mechercharimyces sp. CAU 1602]|uniref:ribonuclease J1 n=1 Tax=Mechercharimyces sp. CAU 1602 TaxID=2973933 RepID=UPI002162E946|nr:ribonuclease J [Mechercharimyces sp. CAU 1602]MCS1351255.1 ribonuclease J [Mechercharimyces sp. CAU 1602]
MSRNNSRGKCTIFALGGLDEIGKNMYVIQYDNDIVVVDSGLMFPEDEMLGIDVVIPDVSYLVENKDKVRGIIITHGHEDHIGGLPYILRQLNVPIYATKLTMGLIEHKLREAHLLNETKRILVSSKSEIRLGSMTATFFKTNHSIPDSVGVCIDTPDGAVVHTGDFKFDMNPVNGQEAELHKMAAIGKKGVLCLLSDSTNAEKPGFTGSESSVGEALHDVFRKSKQRIIVATFASNVHRIQQVVEATIATGRKLAVMGRSMVNVVNISTELGYLNVPDGLIIDPDEIGRLPAHKVTVISTGSQGEPMSALTRMAHGTHRKIDIVPGDTVVLASHPIPGNEKYVAKVVDQLFRAGAEVIYNTAAQQNVHVSGHGSQEDLKLMLNLIKPKYFIPIHGEYRMLRAHGQLAESVGIRPENVFICDNGDTVEFVNGRARYGAKVATGNILIDGLGVGDVGNIVLRDRKLLSQDGILVVVVTLSKQNGTVLSGPDIISRGFVYVRESEKLLDEANRIVTQTMERCVRDQVSEWSSLKTSIRDSLSRFLYDRTRRRPMILPIIMEV